MSRVRPWWYPSLSPKSPQGQATRLTRVLIRPYLVPRMRAIINGDAVELPEGLTVLGLLQHLGVRGERVAVERNGVVVKRALREAERVCEGDVLEVVTFVGGG